jgi:protein O-GlcNAc transferase
MTLQEQLESGVSHHRAGQLVEAEKIYRQVLAQQPDNPGALHLLGVLAIQSRQLESAVDLIQRAIRLKPDSAAAYSNLGKAFIEMGQPDEAIASYRQAIGINPNYAEAHANLGSALRGVGRLDEAVASCREAIRVNPDYGEAYYNLGNALMDKRQIDEAIDAYQQSIGLRPGFAEAHNNLGNALVDAGRRDQAIASFREAIRLDPNFAEAHNNLGSALEGARQLDDATASYRQAIQLNPDLGKAQCNLGNVLKDAGRLDEAIGCYQQAVLLNPDYGDAHSNLVFGLHLHPSFDAEMIRQELRRWNQRHAVPLAKFIQPHTNDPNPDRRLRIGYVSPDFRDHVVGQNLLPLFREHDRRQVEIFCYANMVRGDAFTEQIRKFADAWRGIAGMSDSHAADLIRRDQIDILVDLTLHSAHHRLLVFAQKPAPVQATYLGYCSSTGLETIDYRLSDPYLDPPDSDLSRYSEKMIRLPQTYWCYNPRGPTPAPSPPPVDSAGHITFGCLNNFAKVSPALDLWAEILRSVPRSRLILHSPAGAHLDAVRQRFAGNGVSPDRLEFPAQQPWSEYVRTYGRIDIALDPFPWGGGITTCEALWMGVPVVTLVGRTPVGRGGASILSNVGLPELIAHTPQEYMEIAAGLARDLPRLAELRRMLRPRMDASPLMDAPKFARNMEAAYRQMWQTWCAEGEVR